MYLVLILGSVAVGILIPSIIALLVNRNFDYVNCRTDQRITAKQFFALYSIAPERWTFNEYSFCATYRRDVVKQNVIYCAGDKKYGDLISGVEEYITFKTYRDALRVRHYFRKKEKRKNDARIMKHRAELLKAWQKDINEFLDKNIIEQGV